MAYTDLPPPPKFDERVDGWMFRLWKREFALNFSAGTQSANLTGIVFSNSNGVTFGLSSNTITASHNALTSQSNQAVSGSNGSFTFQTVTFGNLNNFSFYTSNGSMVASYQQTVGLYVYTNTTGQSSSTTMDARSVHVVGLGAASVGFSAGSLIISA